MGITDRISVDDVVLDLTVGDKHDALVRLAAMASRRLGRPEAEILDALQDRETLGSTALGRGVALPHARLDGDHPALLLFARLASPIDYEARDEEPVDLLILLLWPDAEPEGFLPALAEVCRTLRAPQRLRRLRGAATAVDVVALLQAPVPVDDDDLDNE